MQVILHHLCLTYSYTVTHQVTKQGLLLAQNIYPAVSVNLITDFCILGKKWLVEQFVKLQKKFFFKLKYFLQFHNPSFFTSVTNVDLFSIIIKYSSIWYNVVLHS